MVENIEDVVANLVEFNRYGCSTDENDLHFFKEIIRRGKIFVCAAVDGKFFFCPSRFVGYKENTRVKHERCVKEFQRDGKITTPLLNKLFESKHTRDDEVEEEFLYLCNMLNIEPSKSIRSYWRVNFNELFNIEGLSTGETGFPEEIGTYVEGATKSVLVNRYERSSKARAKCLAHYGYTCRVCQFDFEKVYGEIGKNFIHVHHIVPLSLCNEEYRVDPVRDLRPVCPNCHAMLHMGNPPLTLEELRIKIGEVHRE